jgi:hypothetical protein
MGEKENGVRFAAIDAPEQTRASLSAVYDRLHILRLEGSAAKGAQRLPRACGRSTSHSSGIAS